jgi:hypothetical protein
MLAKVVAASANRRATVAAVSGNCFGLTIVGAAGQVILTAGGMPSGSTNSNFRVVVVDLGWSQRGDGQTTEWLVRAGLPDHLHGKVVRGTSSPRTCQQGHNA